jgi:hypothetical protein
MARRRKTFNPGGPISYGRSGSSNGPPVRSSRSDARLGGTGMGVGPGKKTGSSSAPKMAGHTGPTYPAYVSAFGKKYRSEAGRQGTEAQHVTHLRQVLAQLPKAQRDAYLSGQAHLAFSGKHPQSWVDQWLKRNRSRFGI